MNIRKSMDSRATPSIGPAIHVAVGIFASYTFLYDFHTFTYGLHPIFHRTYTFDQNSIVASQFFPELQK